MIDLKTTLKETLLSYAGEGLNSYAYLMSNAEETAFAVIASASVRGKPVVNTGILARIESGLIIIERDMNDKVVVDALVQNGVPREKIILAYAGETLAAAD